MIVKDSNEAILKVGMEVKVNLVLIGLIGSPGIVDSMEDYCGMTAKITNIDDGYISLDIDNGWFDWDSRWVTATSRCKLNRR